MAKKKPKRPLIVLDHKKGRVCLLEMARVFESLNLPYFLVQGTALGAYRDNGFTPTEGDIDVGFLQEDFSPKASELLKIFCDKGFEVHALFRPFSKCRTIVLDRDGVHVDLVSFILWKDKRFVSRPVDARGLPPYSIVHDRHMIETHDKVTVFDKEFNVPHPIERYFELEYGKDWRIPIRDHTSRTRIYDYRKNERIPNDYLDT